MQVTLQIIDGPFKGRFVPLNVGTTRFGNDAQAEYPLLEDAELSKLHFAVAFREDASVVVDLGSLRGTFINDEPLKGERLLADGDVIRAGASLFRVWFQDLAKTIAAQAASAPEPLTDSEDLQEESDDDALENSQHAKRPGTSTLVPPIALPQIEWTLEVESGPDLGHCITLIDQQQVILGSSPEADYMVLGESTVSAKHCQVVCQAKTCTVSDLNSSHGTSVNGRDVGQVSLKHGDLLTLGNTRFRVVAGPGTGKTASDVGPASRVIRASRPYASAVEDEDLTVRRLAIEAAVWTRQPWIKDYCRQCCQQPLPAYMPAYEMLAILGGRKDLPSIQCILGAEALGIERMRIAGMFGFSECIEWLLHQLAHADGAIAIAAARSFAKICGVGIDSDKGVPAGQQNSSSEEEMDHEFQPEGNLPDIAKAREHWETHRNRYKKGARWCRGFEIGATVSPAVINSLDHESRWEVALRAQYSGSPLANPQTLTRFNPRYSGK